MACCKCCDDPCYQNFNRLVMLILSTIAWAFSIVAVAHCSFWRLDSSRFSDELLAGLFKWENEDGSCEKYPDYIELSTTHTIGRAFGVLAATAIGFAVVGIASTMFFLEEGRGAIFVWNATRILYVLALLFIMATFSFIHDCIDDMDEYEAYGNGIYVITCSLGAAGILDAVAFWILLGVSITSCCTPVMPHLGNGVNSGPMSSGKHSYNEKPQANQDDMERPAVSGEYVSNSVVKRTIEVTPNGRKITEEIVNPDGSRVITETVETNIYE